MKPVMNTSPQDETIAHLTKLVHDAYHNPAKRFIREERERRALDTRVKDPKKIAYEEAFMKQLERVVPRYSRQNDEPTLLLERQPVPVKFREIEYTQPNTKRLEHNDGRK